MVMVMEIGISPGKRKALQVETAMLDILSFETITQE
jgi:hypothetical protein